MKTKKSIIAILGLCAIMVFSSTIVIANDVARIENRVRMDNRLTDQNAPIFFPDDFDFRQARSEDDAKLAQLIRIQSSQPQQHQTPSSTTWYTLSSLFTMVGQIHNNYCVPACVRAILGHLNGGLSSVPSQTTIATNLGTGAPGTTGTPFNSGMLTFINNHHSRPHNYVFHTATNIGAMRTRLRGGINTFDKASMLWIITCASSEWGIDYNHAVVAYRFSTDQNTVGIADPWPLYAGSGSTFYTISAAGVFDALIAMVW